MSMAAKQKVRIAAYGVLVDARRQILLCRLSSVVQHAVGRWTLPGGGIEFGEDPARAVVREVEEETGLQVTADGVLHVASKVRDWTEARVHSVQIIYRLALVGPATPLRYEVGGSTDLCAWHPLLAASQLGLVDVSEWAVQQVLSNGPHG